MIEYYRVADVNFAMIDYIQVEDGKIIDGWAEDLRLGNFDNLKELDEFAIGEEPEMYYGYNEWEDQATKITEKEYKRIIFLKKL